MLEKIRKHFKNPINKNSYSLIANNLITSAIGFFFWIIVARLYPTASFGLAVAVISAAGIISNLSLLGIDISIIRFLSKQENKVRFLNTCISSVLIISLILSIIFLLGIDSFDKSLSFLKSSFWNSSMFIVYVLCFSLYTIFSYIFIALRKSEYCVFQNTFSSIAKILLAVFLVSFGFLGIFSSFALSLLISCIIGLIFLKKLIINFKPKFLINVDTIKDLSKFSFSNYLVGIATSAPIFLIPLLILGFLGPTSNAYYYVAFAIANILFTIPASTSTSLFAEGSHEPDLFPEKLIKSIIGSYLILIPPVLVTIIFGKIILLIFGVEYSINSYYLLSALAISSIFITLSAYYQTYLRIKLKMKALLIIVFTVSISILVLSSIFLSIFGILGVGFAYLIVYGILGIFILISFRIFFNSAYVNFKSVFDNLFARIS